MGRVVFVDGMHFTTEIEARRNRYEGVAPESPIIYYMFSIHDPVQRSSVLHED